MSAKSSPRLGQTGAFNETVLDYFARHAIDPQVAAVLGVTGTDKGVNIPYKDYPYGEVAFTRERDFSAGKTRQPAGVKLEPWMPVATDGWLLVCEGESDCLAAISALYEVAGDPDEGEGLELWRRDDLPPPLKGAMPIAVPGAGPCHGHVVALAKKIVADVAIAFDGDDAGRQGAAKLATAIDAEDHIAATVIELPDGLDMADVLAAADDPTAALAELVAEAEAADEDVAPEGDLDAPAEVEPLPNGAVSDLLKQAADLLTRYVVLPGDDELVALALFVAHSHAVDGAHATPYILAISPEKRSGKSKLLGVLEQLVARPWGVIGASEAAMFRKIAKDRPTMLLDEIDAIFGSQVERTEPIRAILNAGNRPGATVARCVGENKDVEDFPIFCAKVLAGIDSGHRIPDTIRDRAVTIAMQRKTGAEPVERFRYRDADAEAKPIREALERWSVGAVDLLLEADPDLPHELDDRAAEAWEPLIAIADMAGEDWPAKARAAAVALSGQADRDETTTGTLLLDAVHTAFGDRDRMTTVDLLGAINGDDELPFGGWRDGKGLDGRRLARLLKPYGVRPRTIRTGERTEKGYMRESLTEAWARWLPTRTEPSHASQPSHGAHSDTQIPLDRADVTVVTDVTAAAGSNGTVTATEVEEAEVERIAAKLETAA